MLERNEHVSGVVTYQSPLLRDMGLLHAFSTRIGGVSRGQYASLNLVDGDDDADDVAENQRRLGGAIGADYLSRIEVKQVHGAAVCVANGPTPDDSPLPHADAIITTRPQLLLSIRVADCAAILLASRCGKVVGAIHAGWRGVVGGVIGATLASIRQNFGVQPVHLTAAVGPCIGCDHFEVGAEVVDAYVEVSLDAVVDRDQFARPHIDLAQAAVVQLRRGGLPADLIDTTDLCTYRDADLFFSHRRDKGQTGRMAAMIGRAV
jgi:YfiH family protein